MNRAVKFLRLPFADQWLLIKSAALLGMIRLSLEMLPFRLLLRGVERLSETDGKPKADQDWISRTSWAVTTASRYIPRATCLTQALTTKLLLGRRGHPAQLHIGVARGEAKEFKAHAWVEAYGETVIGGWEDLPRYAKLSSLHGKSTSFSP